MMNKIEGHSKNVADVQSQPRDSVIEIRQGETFRHDASRGSLFASYIVNNGAVEIYSSDESATEACLEVAHFSGSGNITCSLPSLRFRTAMLNCGSGMLKAEEISVESDDALFVKGGVFDSKRVHFKAKGELNVHADRIDAEVSVCAEKVSFGVAAGVLNVAKSDVFGDPVFYNRAGDLNVSPAATGGEDLYAFATGNITIASIDTTGGNASHPGRIVIESGCVSITPDANPPTNSPVQTACVDCYAVRTSLNVVSAAEPTGVVIINGNVSGKNLSIRADDVTINGDVLIDADNNAEGGFAQVDFNTDLVVDGTITVVGTAGKGKLTLSGTQTLSTFNQSISVTGAIDADVLFVTLNAGTTSFNDIDGDMVEVYSGGAVTPGGTIDVSGTGTEAGGSITVVAADVLDLTNAQFLANGGTTGDGGSVSLSSGSGNLGLHSNLISAAAGTGSGSNASGGQVSVQSIGDLTLSADFSLNGVGTGAGGSIELRATGALDLGIHTVAADGGNIGAGGSVSLFSGSNFSVDPTKLSVNGGQGSGSNASGGGIAVESSANLTLSGSVSINGIGAGSGGAVMLSAGGTLSLGSNTITCNGGSTGSGGVVKLASGVNFTFDPNKVSVNVGAGSGSDANGGSVEVVSAANLTLSGSIGVNGIGDGAGGRVVLSAAGMLAIGSNTISANGGDTGDGGYVSLTSNDDISLAFGQVSIGAGQDSASDGTGGTLLVVSAADVTIGADIHLDGEGNGWGGNLLLRAGGTLGISTYNLSANGGETGSGGRVNLQSGSALTIASGQVTASAGAGTGSNADGGTIEIIGINNVTVSGSLNVNGIGTGAGGRIAIDSGATLSVGSNSFSAQGGTTGNGGFIDLVSAAALSLAASQLSVTAGIGTGSNAAGGSVALTTTADLTLTGTLSVNGVGTGAGGSILVNAGQELDVSMAVLQANGGTLGHGGAVEITSGANLSLWSSQVSVLSGAESGANTNGGFITISTTDEHTLELSGTFSVDGHGSGVGGAFTVDSSSTLTLVSAQVSVNSVAETNNVSAGKISLGGFGLNIDSASQLLANGVPGGAVGGQIELTHYGTAIAEINGMIRANGSKGGQIEIKCFDGAIESDATIEANTAAGNVTIGAITIDSPVSITFGGTCEAAGALTFSAPKIWNTNSGNIYGNSISLLSGSQPSLEVTNDNRIETKDRGSVPYGELKIGSALNNLPYRLTLKCTDGTTRLTGNPITIESAGDLNIEAFYYLDSNFDGPPNVLAAGESYSVNIPAKCGILSYAKLTVRAERVNHERDINLDYDIGTILMSYSDIEITSPTRLIANLREVDCINLILNAEDVKVVALLNPDFNFSSTGTVAKVSGEARSGDFVIQIDKYEENRGFILNSIPGGDVILGDIFAAGSVEVDCRRGRITNAPGTTIVAENGHVNIIQGTLRQGNLTLENVTIRAHDGDVNIVVDHVPTEAPELASGVHPSGDVTVIPTGGNVFWGQQGITIGGTGNSIEVAAGSAASQKAVFYTYNKGAGSIVLNGNVNLVLTSGCLCDLPVDNGNIYYGDGTNIVALSPGTDGQLLTTHVTLAPTWGDGATGPEGPVGATGSPGATGAAGATGSTGPKGPAGLVWRGAWSSFTSYVVDDAVSQSGNSYIATANNTNDSPPSSNWNLLAAVGDAGANGATGAQGPTGATGNSGAQGPKGIAWHGTWSSSTAYVVDDAVVLNGTAYIATANNTNSSPPSANWSTLAAKGDVGATGTTGATGATGSQGSTGATGTQGAKGPKGLVWRGAWGSSTSYFIDDAVSSNGISYIAIANNTNSAPPSANWQQLSAKGDTGATGFTGAQGATGEMGAQGAQGPTGAQGPQGPTGPNGDPGRKSVMKTSDTTRISTTTLADDPHLSLALEANKTYHFFSTFTIDMEASGPHFKMTFVGPSGSTINWSAVIRDDFLSGSGGTSQSAVAVDGGANLAVCYGSIAVGSTAGNLTLQWAQNTNQNRNVTLKSTGLLVATPL